MLEIIMERFDDLLLADGFDEAVIGIDESTDRIVYSVSKCIKILMSGGMEVDEAIEYFNFNVSGAYVGEKTPIWCQDHY